MERSLLWSVLALGGAGWLCGLLLARTRLTEAAKRLSVLPRPYLVTALALPFLVFLATLPSHPPLFTTGHGLGNGFLLGGLGALLSALLPLLSSRGEEGDTNPLRPAAILSATHGMALVMTALPLLLLRATLLDTLLGVAIGWLCVVVILYRGSLQYENTSLTESSSTSALLPLTLLSGVVFVTLLCALAALGEMRGKVDSDLVPDGVSLSAIALIFAAGVPFLLLLTSLPNRIFLQMAQARADAAPLAGTPVPARLPLAATVWRVVLSVGLLTLLGRLLSRHLLEHELPKSAGLLHLIWLALGPSRLFHVMGLGLLVGLLAWWLTVSQARQESEAQDATAGWQNGALAILTVLGGFMGAYQLAKGLGVGLMLTGAWMSFALALTSGLETEDASLTKTPTAPLLTATRLLRLGFFGSILLLYRLLTSRFDAASAGVALSDHYAVFGLLVGGMLPLLLSGFLLRPVSASPLWNVFRLACAGAILLAVPALVIVLWGAKCVLALLIGLALSIALEAGRGTTNAESDHVASSTPPYAFLPALFSLGTGLALSQWMGHVLQAWQLTRAEKIHILGYIVFALVLLVLLADYGGRFLNHRRAPLAPDSVKGAAS